MGKEESKLASDKSAAQSAAEADVASGEILDEHVQHLEQPFNLWSTLGIQFSITATPLSIGTYLSVSISSGGGPVFFFGYIVAVALNLLVCASLAEIAAVHPHASGKPTPRTRALPSDAYNPPSYQARSTGQPSSLRKEPAASSAMSLGGWLVPGGSSGPPRPASSHRS